MSDPSDFAKLIVRQNREQIEFRAQNAISQGLEVPVVLLLHLDDERAREIVRHGGRGAEFETVRSNAKGRDLDAVVVWAVPARFARTLLMPAFSEFAPELVPLSDPAAYHLVVIVDGFIGLVQLQLPECAL